MKQKWTAPHLICLKDSGAEVGGGGGWTFFFAQDPFPNAFLCKNSWNFLRFVQGYYFYIFFYILKTDCGTIFHKEGTEQSDQMHYPEARHKQVSVVADQH